jgi:hypothetical protein
MLQIDAEIDWLGDSEASRNVAIRVQDARFRRAMGRAHPERLPPSARPPRAPREVVALPVPEDSPRALHWQQIVAEVADKYDYTPADIKGDGMERRLVAARYETFWRLRTETTMSSPMIGAKLNRDHSTVLYGVRKHQARIGGAT